MASDPMASQDVPLISSVAVAAEKRLKSGNLSPREVRGSSRIHQMLRLVDSQWLVGGFKHFFVFNHIWLKPPTSYKSYK
jgi:hypothetical protein